MKTPFAQTSAQHDVSQTCTAKKLLTLVALVLTLFAHQATAQTLPSGFSQVLVANGISNPTVMAFAPDGRIFVAQQTGQLRIIKNGALLATPFISLSVNSSGERGLLGIAFDPNFATNNYIYLYYTVSSAAYNRISRFTANGDVALAGSEQVVLNLDALGSATNHNGGTMQFGPDGKLYVGVGENANTANSQNLDKYLGKILRINPDGSIPTGNPYTTGTAQRRRVWASGLRNPYTLTFQPGTGKLFINDVGQNAWEEINDGTIGGKNFGWPAAEGNSTNPAYTNPVYYYGHGSGVGVGCAITGGTFFNPPSTNYPTSYIGKYFFLDYCNRWIDQLSLSGSTATRSNFGSNIAGSAVCIVTGNDGNLYFLSRDNSAVYKIVYTASTAPLITNQPQSATVALGSPASFSVTATGSAPLSYQWRKNGSNITGATASTYSIANTTAASAGTYSVVVSNSAGSVTSNNATLTISAANQPPVANIVAPAAGATYAGGQVINFSGTATDPENGTLPASAYHWYVLFYHDTHNHPGPSTPSGVSSGSFTIPNTGETAANVFYRLYLVVTDAQGATDTSYTDIIPRTSTITLNTQPQGLTVTIDGQPVTVPTTITSVEGVLRTFGTNSPQTLNGVSYSFSSWSQGGAQTQTIATPVNDAVYTASFSTGGSTVSTVRNSIADAAVRSGSFANTNYGSATSMETSNASGNAGYQTYIRFNIGTIPLNPVGVIVRLYGALSNANIASAQVQLFNVPASTSWQEATLTDANKPAAETTPVASLSVTGTSKKFYEWDVTQFIIDLRAQGITSVTFAVKTATPTPTSTLVFNSKENAAYKPQMKLTVNAPSNLVVPDYVSAKFGSVGSIVVYPNPAADYFIFTYPAAFTGTKLRMRDLSGRTFKEIVLNGAGTQRIPIDDVQKGMYFLSVEKDGKKLTEKVTVVK